MNGFATPGWEDHCDRENIFWPEENCAASQKLDDPQVTYFKLVSCVIAVHAIQKNSNHKDLTR
jgi:hypothetical protein